MESMYEMRGVVKVISISLRYMCVCVCMVSGEFSLDGKYVWDAGCNDNGQQQRKTNMW